MVCSGYQRCRQLRSCANSAAPPFRVSVNIAFNAGWPIFPVAPRAKFKASRCDCDSCCKKSSSVCNTGTCITGRGFLFAKGLTVFTAAVFPSDLTPVGVTHALNPNTTPARQSQRHPFKNRFIIHPNSGKKKTLSTTHGLMFNVGWREYQPQHNFPPLVVPDVALLLAAPIILLMVQSSWLQPQR